MSKEDTTAVELLTKIGTIVLAIETNLHHNRLDRKTIRKLLRQYSARAESDGRLMNAAREEPDCANRGLFLAYSHMELVTWLGNNNYTIPSSSIRWYSWKQFLSKYRLPPFWTSSYASDLQSQLDHIEKTAALVCADLEAHNISIPATAIGYPKVPVGEPAAPPPEAYETLLSRGTRVQKRLEGSVDN